VANGRVRTIVVIIESSSVLGRRCAPSVKELPSLEATSECHGLYEAAVAPLACWSAPKRLSFGTFRWQIEKRHDAYSASSCCWVGLP
jgi:hypothetical protein